MWTKLNDVWKWYDYDTETAGVSIDGVFHRMSDSNQFEQIFGSLDITADDLDMEYHGTYSGQKIISPLVDTLLDGEEELTNDKKDLIASTILRANYDRWKKLAATYFFEYNPISNYDMKETEETGKTTEYGREDTRTDNLTRTENETDALQHGESISQSGNRSQTTNFTNRHDVEEKTVAGWNSSNYSNADRVDKAYTGSESVTNGGTDTEAHTGTDTRTINGSVANTGTQKYASDGSDTESTERTLTRSGNIGVTTTQQMLQQERELYLWDFVRDVVFKDIDKFLTIMVY